MSQCAVATCHNHSQKTKGQQISYHRFPKKKSLQKAWIIRCKRADEINVNNERVCSAHFGAEDFERDLRSVLLGLPIKNRLKDDAVPSYILTVAAMNRQRQLQLKKGSKFRK
jgi:hypothetical protein